ncbi:hypothetical protein SAMN05216276_101060 [Streptosporangium subroseum]|uniref:Uncharacterized protein n=1 Tax=Streptosporangium subroseum TaxID=106412 RepID=A0A239ETF8_9ACTN|nr:hypothetical protein SAMN05216276_101060 [Streptosporangium subroseum]
MGLRRRGREDQHIGEGWFAAGPTLILSVLSDSFESEFDRGPIDSSCDRFNRGGKRFMLPEADNLPARRSQRSISCAVTLDVTPQLGSPVPLVRGGLPAVHRADVPEASVDKYGDLPCSEDDVWPDPDSSWQIQPEVLAVPVATRVQGFPERDLGLRIGPPVGPHVPRTPLAGCSRVSALRLRYRRLCILVHIGHDLADVPSVCSASASIGEDSLHVSTLAGPSVTTRRPK